MNSIALSKRKDFAAYRATWVFAAALCLLILQALQAAAQMMPNTFADLAEEISPSVVNITTTTVIAGRADQRPRGIVPKGSPFEEFFREFEDRRRGGNGDVPKHPCQVVHAGVPTAQSCRSNRRGGALLARSAATPACSTRSSVVSLLD